jgi:lipopolysaccharide export system protein LptA
MSRNITRLRYWFAGAAVFVIVVVAGFFFYARIRIGNLLHDAPKKLGVDIQQSAEGFTLSKSEGGRTLFKVQASKAVSYKEGGRAQLNDVNIIVYGRSSDRFDQIYGKQFEYDPKTHDITAPGEVNIDLQSASPDERRTDQSPPQELKNPIHIRTSGLTFNESSGTAATAQQVEFKVPQAHGTAEGARYDSKAKALTLDRDIKVTLTGDQSARILAQHGVITDQPRRAVFDNAHVERPTGNFDATQVTVFLRPDNSVDHVIATGDVRGTAIGKSKLTVKTTRAEAVIGSDNDIRTATLSGGVDVVATGQRAMNAQAGHAVLEFGSNRQVRVAHATEHVHITQPPATPTAPNAQTNEIFADAMDFFIREGDRIERAETIGAAQIVSTPAQQTANNAKTTVTAGKFVANFDPQGRVNRAHGAPNARTVSSTPGQPDKVTISNQIDVAFNSEGGLDSLVQQGSFEYHEAAKTGDRAAYADKAIYVPASDILRLTGSPRVVDGTMTTTADIVTLNRRTGDAEGQTNVKTTYSDLKPNPQGGMFASSDPIHITARSMVAQRGTGQAKYTGNARLWQGPNIVEGNVITFERDKRQLNATGTPSHPVNTILVQQDKSGKVTPVTIRAQHLSYDDNSSTAHYDGGVIVRGAGGTMTAAKMDIYLKKSGPQGVQAAKNAQPGPAELDHIVAETNVKVEQDQRRAAGSKLVYTAADDKFVMTGGPPTLSDPEHGTISGTSLTFFRGDDKVLVDGGPSRTVTTTRVSK